MSGKEIEASNVLPQTLFSCVLENDGVEWAISSALDFASSAIVGAPVSIHVSRVFESFILMRGTAVDVICTFSKGSLRLRDSSVPIFEGITCYKQSQSLFQHIFKYMLTLTFFESKKSLDDEINMKAGQGKARMSMNLRELAATYSGPPEGILEPQRLVG